MDHHGQFVADLTVQGQGFMISVGGGPADGARDGLLCAGSPGDPGRRWCRVVDEKQAGKRDPTQRA
jgi:hypothetical protein